MTAPRSLDGGRSPLAPMAMFDARASLDAIGEVPGFVGGDAGDFWASSLDALDAFLGGGA